MGRSFESFALHRSDLDPVRTALEEWLTERGLVPRRDHVIDTLLSDDACRVVLFHNAEWTVVLYSHPFQQTDSIEAALSNVQAPLLKTWVYDSDLWGYELRVQGQL